MVEKIGLKAILDTKAYKRGLADYIGGLAKMTKETAKTSGKVSKVSALIGKGMKVAAVAAVAAAAAITAALAITGIALVKLGINAALTASRVNELNLVAQLLGQRAGFAEQEINAFIGGIKEAGIRADVASQLVAQFARNQLDLTKAIDLATIAQGAAVLAGKDSSQTLDDLVRGIITYSKVTLRMAGLNIDVQGSFDALAKELGITTAQLTEVQKTQAVLGAVLQEGSKLAGVYEIAMESAGKQLRSLPRDLFDLQVALGEPLQEAFLNIVKGARAFTQAITEAVGEGGKLRPLLINIGAVLSLATEGFSDAARKIVQVAADITNKLGITFAGAAESAFDWGIDIAVALADGLIKGASAAITAAMNFIGNLLTSWLAPGSPPRIAPELDKWGAAALTEWLEGMTQADFDVLKAIQGPLKSILSGEKFQQVTAGLIESLGTGDMQGFFAKITTAGGEFGAEIAQLAQQEMELASAIRTVTQAEKDLADARKAQTQAMSQVAKLTAEYNELLRDNADPAILQAQLDQINAAEEQAQVAAAQAAAAEETLTATEGEIGTMKEQLSLQEQLVNQLLGLADAQDEVAAAGGAIGAAGAALADLLTGGIPGGGAGLELPDIGSLLAEKIEEAKGLILEKLDDMLQPVRDKFSEWKDIIEDLGKKWVWFTGILNEFWEKKVNPILIWINENLLTPLKNVWKFIREFILPVLKSLGTMILLGLKVSFKNLWFVLTDLVLPALSDLWDWFNVKLREALEFLGVDVDTLGTTFETFKQNILDKIIEGFEWFKTLLGKVRDKIDEINRLLRNFDPSALWPFIGTSPSPLEIGLRGIIDAMDDLNFRSLPGFQMNMLPATTGSQVNIRNDFGGNNISSGMDMAMLERKIISVVSAAVRNAT